MSADHTTLSNEGRKPNRLVREKSPYLLQHAYNPVDWYPWGEDAFEKARTENRPIFLSIGYSSCHWCHVLAHESFEDKDVAKLLNDNFVCIKVDREERPDVDQVYMKAVQAMTGSGGWPLSVFLTPKLEPFYGGTYFPPTSRYGMPGFSIVLRKISEEWKSNQKEIMESAARMGIALKESSMAAATSGSSIVETVFDSCFADLAQSFDENYGGFGGAPKFPTSSISFFLMRYGQRSNRPAALQMVVRTLEAMAAGGIYDQIGGGFHRYSTDRFWLVPHFEKMLYDNALLSIAYSEAYLITRNPGFKRVATETIGWVIREMSAEKSGGGYYSAQDADSPEGEGSFYTWSSAEIRGLLSRQLRPDGRMSKEECDVVLEYYTVTESGNFEDGKSVLTASKDTESLAKQFGMTQANVESIIEKARTRLYEARSARPRPMTDDKIITSWNGMMISAISKAFQVFGEKGYLDSALKAADFIISRMTTQNERGSAKVRLSRRFRDGEVKESGVLEDYAYFGNSLIDLYEACFDSKYLKLAVSICDSMIDLFCDRRIEGGGFFETSEEVPYLIARPKEAFDGAVPSGNSIAALFCLRIAEITSDERYREVAEGTFKAFWSSIEANPASFTEMISALEFFFDHPREIVLSGDPAQEDLKLLISELRRHYLPNSVVILAEEGLSDLPILEGRVQSKGAHAKTFVCINSTCKLPSTTPEELSLALSG